jgi:hypothetical protein
MHCLMYSSPHSTLVPSKLTEPAEMNRVHPRSYFGVVCSTNSARRPSYEIKILQPMIVFKPIIQSPIVLPNSLVTGKITGKT